MSNLYIETQAIMKKYGISANKNLGQNFLIDENALNEIVECSNISKDDLIIEIGPGLGTLTERLVQLARLVIVIELDKKMVEVLSDRFKYCDNIIILNEDVLKVNLKDLILKYKENGKVKIVANLPYYITTPIIMTLLEQRLELESITVMIQKEVAQRLTAKPGDKLCGAITASVNYYSQPNEILLVGSQSFLPSPKVDSEVIRLDILVKPRVKVVDEKLFFSIIRIAFSQRRKTFLNTLVNNRFIDKTNATKMLNSLGIDINRRGETFSIEEFAKIENYITNIKDI